LRRHEIKEGDRVILCGHNSPEWVAAFWACLLVGAVVVPLDKESTANFVSSVQQQTGARLIISDRDVRGIKQSDLPILTLDTLSEKVSSHSMEPLPATPNDSTLAQIIFTSGTTSTPKGVMLTHGNLLANLLPLEHEVRKYLKWERFVHPVRFLNLVPLSHVFGQVMGMFVPQLLGGEVHFHDNLNPAAIVERTRSNRISVIVLVPRLLASLQHWIERSNLHGFVPNEGDTSLLKRWWKFRKVHRKFGWKFWAFLSGGATLDQQTENFWRSLGFAVLQGYGMTETASLISVTHPFKANRGSIGKLMPGYEVNLEQGGEIVVRGPSVSPGYWTSEGQAFRTSDQWLHTGDVGTIDDSGNLYFKGRAKEVIVTAAGLNIYPEDLEEALNRQSEVRSSCVINASGAHGHEPLAVLILRNPNATVSAIIDRANQGLSEYQRIRRWHIWDAPEFPLTSTQKIIRREVAATIEAGVKRNGHVSTSSSSVVSEAMRISGEELLPCDDSSLKLATDLKLDSLGRIELLSALEDKFQIEIDEAAFTEATTVGDVEDLVRGEMSERSISFPYPTWSHRFPVTWIRALLFYAIILPVTCVMSRLRIQGTANLKDVTEPVLFVANHVTLGDHALVLVGLPLRLRHRVAIAMEGERLRTWLHPPAETGLFMRLRFLAQYVLVTTFFQVFPLPRKSGFRRSFEYAASCIERGESVLVFPEGVRAPRGQMHMSNFKIGIGLLAQELDVPVVPVRLDGLYELKRRRQYFAAKGMVSVNFGSPVRFDRSMSTQLIAKELERLLEDL
jgi:long-chain acyl-CoA synthetase